MTSEELHNSRIRDNYARLINPEYKIEDLFEDNKNSQQPQVQAQAQVQPENMQAQSAVMPEVMPQQTIEQQRPYLVENARADAAIFRADNPVNLASSQTVAQPAQAPVDEEDNEDLRPTDTTIQYKSVKAQSQKNSRKTEIKINAEESVPILSKKEKIIIGVFVALVLSLFVLVIINSAIIANLSSDLSSLNTNLTTVKGALAGVNSQINQLVTPEAIDDFAKLHGLVIK
jgi:cell division protein FtsL